MKRHVLRLMVLLNLLLLAALLLMWLRPNGSLRGTAWNPPAPHLSDFAAQLPALPSPAPSNTANFVAMLERPLFSASRRPPPPPPPPVATAEAAVDNFSAAKLTGVFEGNGAGGVIIRIADKDKRLQLNQVLEGWTLKSISGRDVTFTKGSEKRVMQLQRAGMTGGAVPAGAAPAATKPAASVPSAFLPPASGQPSNATAEASSPSAAAAASASATRDQSANPASAPQAPRAVFGGTRSR